MALKRRAKATGDYPRAQAALAVARRAMQRARASVRLSKWNIEQTNLDAALHAGVTALEEIFAIKKQRGYP